MRDRLPQAIRYLLGNNRKSLAWMLHRYPNLKSAANPRNDNSLLLIGYSRYPSILPWLLSEGVSPNTPMSDGGTVLMMASAANNLSAVKLLLANGADVNARNSQGETAFSYAAIALRKRR